MVSSVAFRASGDCQQLVGEQEQDIGIFVVSTLEDNRSITTRLFNDSSCTLPLLQPVQLTKTIQLQDTNVMLNNSACSDDNLKWTSDLSAYLAGGGLISPVKPQTSNLDLLLSTKSRSAFVELTSPLSNQLSVLLHQVTQKTTPPNEEAREPLGLWDDSVITAERIYRRKVMLHQLLSSTAFGDIYVGSYQATRVAFPTNTKWAAATNHPRIVHFIGVAWETPADLCVVLELMEGGDSHTLLKTYKSTKRPGGIDRDKTSIAMHVCHALTYFHSSSPPTVFGDVTSRNILLNDVFEAKLKNFRRSRRRDKMFPGAEMLYSVAPEVMLGAKCSEKIDIFAFGILLAELDAHKPPSVQVDFSADVPETLAELGLACVSPDPSMRPSATEVMTTQQDLLRGGLD
ncbi:hypothetical protein ON010_g3764 [Phytophthora cinnamomi]|nr:hypothetical protein ON010_g3764 [Phytophthora cinnamomi]